jgi:hypothetical protein
MTKDLDRCELKQLGDLLVEECGYHAPDELGLTDRQWQFAEVVRYMALGKNILFADMDYDIFRYMILGMDLSL